jgi:hypothetical protein
MNTAPRGAKRRGNDICPNDGLTAMVAALRPPTLPLHQTSRPARPRTSYVRKARPSAAFPGGADSSPVASIAGGSDDNQRSHGPRPDYCVVPADHASTCLDADVRAPAYRFDRRRSSGRGVRGACSGALARQLRTATTLSARRLRSIARTTTINDNTGCHANRGPGPRDRFRLALPPCSRARRRCSDDARAGGVGPRRRSRRPAGGSRASTADELSPERESLRS